MTPTLVRTTVVRASEPCDTAIISQLRARREILQTLLKSKNGGWFRTLRRADHGPETGQRANQRARSAKTSLAPHRSTEAAAFSAPLAMSSAALQKAGAAWNPGGKLPLRRPTADVGPCPQKDTAVQLHWSTFLQCSAQSAPKSGLPQGMTPTLRVAFTHASMRDNQCRADNGSGRLESGPAASDTEKSLLLSRNAASQGSKYGSSTRRETAPSEYQTADPGLETVTTPFMTTQDTPPPPPPPPRRGTGSGADKDARSVSWSDLPQKKQLIVITLARLSEPLVQTSLQVLAHPLPKRPLLRC